MKRFLGLLAVPALLGAQEAPSREFRIDAGHSVIEFSVPFIGHKVRGRFDDVHGTIVYAPSANGGVGTSSVRAAIATASINTGSKHRDEHLRSEDFFDAARFPFITFESTGLLVRDTLISMSGRLTMHGVTRPVVIPFRPSGPAVDTPQGHTVIHFTGALRLARKDFGILGGAKHNEWFDAIRSATMGDSVDVALEISGWRKRQ